MVDTLIVSEENAQTCIDIAEKALQYARGNLMDKTKPRKIKAWFFLLPYKI